MRNKHWLKFHKYAVRVRFLRGPCNTIPPSIQRIILVALAHFADSSSPLLPNLTELTWDEWDRNLANSTVPLIKYFAEPRVTTLSLFLEAWPSRNSERSALTNLPDLCPNVTSLTAMFRYNYVDRSAAVGDFIRRWSDLQVLRTSELSQSMISELPCWKDLARISVAVTSTTSELVHLPSVIRRFSLEGTNAWRCIRYLRTLQGSPTHLHLHVGQEDIPFSMDMLFQLLPTRLDTTQLENLTISFRSMYCRPLPPLAFPLTEGLLQLLYPLSALVSLNLNTFCASGLNDAAYRRLASAWPKLRCLKIGVADETRVAPVATVGAVIAVLKLCPSLETLHIVFNGSVPPPLPRIIVNAEEEDRAVATSYVGPWGVSNQHITAIHVGHSPIVADRVRLSDLVVCLRSIMPRLGIIQSRTSPREVADSWRTAQHMLLETFDWATCDIDS